MVVLDCNAAVAIARGLVQGDAMKMLMCEGEKTIAPDLFYSEAGNTLWKMEKASQIDKGEIEGCLSSIAGLVDEFYPDKELVVEALFESIRLNYPIYDMLYLVLARRNNATLFTLDKKLVNCCIKCGVNVIEEVAF